MTCTAEIHWLRRQVKRIHFAVLRCKQSLLDEVSDLLAQANMHVWLPASENLADDVPINQNKDTEVWFLH